MVSAYLARRMLPLTHADRFLALLKLKDRTGNRIICAICETRQMILQHQIILDVVKNW